MTKVTVLLPDDDSKRFAAYCESKGFKKSTLIVRLIREHLDRENFQTSQDVVGRSVDHHQGDKR